VGGGHMATPSGSKNKKIVKTVWSKTCFQNAQKCVFLGRGAARIFLRGGLKLWKQNPS